MLPKFFIFFIAVPCIVIAQDCIPSSDNFITEYKAYNSPISVLAKIRTIGELQHTCQITKVFKINHGGLKKGNSIIIGNITKSPDCPALKKGKEMLLYLEEKDPAQSFYEIKYNPEIIAKKTKKSLPKFMCKGCVTPPKFPKSKTETVQPGIKYKLQCKAKGKPKPHMKIWKDNVPLKSSKGVKVAISKRGGRVVVKFSKFSEQNAGVYVCQASNPMGSINMTKELNIDPCMPCAQDKKNYCVHGKCCFRADLNETLCMCVPDYEGSRCNHVRPNFRGPRINNASLDKKVIAIMGLVMAITVCCIILYVVYRKSKKPKNKRKPRTSRTNAGVDAELMHVRPTGSGVNNSSSFAQHPNSYEPITVTSVSNDQESDALLVNKQRDSPSQNSGNGDIRRSRLNGNSSNRPPMSRRNLDEEETPSLPVPNDIISRQKVPSNFSSTESMVEGENKHTCDPDHAINGHRDLPHDIEHIISQNMYTPPSYMSVEKSIDERDGQEPVSPSSPHRVTTFENDGQVKETTVERVRGVTPHSPKMSPQQLQRQNRVYSRENSEPTNDNNFSTLGSQNPNDNVLYENTNPNYIPMPPHENLSETEEVDDEMKQPLYKSITTAQAHQIPLNSSSSIKPNLPSTLPLSSSSDDESINEQESDSLNRSINV